MKKLLAHLSNPWALIMWLLCLAGSVSIVLTLAGAAMTTSAALYVAIPFSLVYLGVYFAMFYFSGGWPRPALGWVIAALLWGGGVVMGIVQVTGNGAVELPRQLGLDIFSASLAGAWPEEIGKDLGVLFVLLAFARFSKPWHGLMIGAFVGLGFTIVENIGYGASGGILNPVSDSDGVMHLWMIRSLAGPTQHAVYTGLAGWGIALALYAVGKSMSWRISRAFGFIMLGFLCHFVWNASPSSTMVNYMTMGLAAVVGYGSFIYLMVRTYKQAKRPVES